MECDVIENGECGKGNWRECKLSKIMDIIGGGTPKTTIPDYWDGEIPWLSVKDFNSSNRTVNETEKTITELGLKNSSTKLLNKGDLIISARGTVGAIAQLGKPMAFNQSCYGLRANGATTNNYLYYLLKYKIKSIQKNTHGSVFNTITKDTFEILTASLPTDIEEQKAIAHILSTLDDKIETNNEINKKLEEMSQAIFKRWFVDFEFPNEDGEPYKSSGGEMVESELGMIPEGWEVKKLNEVIDNVKNSTNPGKHLKDRKYIPIDTMSMKSVTVNAFKTYKEANSSLILFEEFDILIGAMRVYFHRVNLAPFKGITRTTTFVLRSKEKKDVAYNLFLLNQDKTINYADKTSKGTTMPYAIWENGLGEMLLAYPTCHLRMRFNSIVFPMLEKMISNANENGKLQNIRDTLLPKLMSGEIRVPINN